MKFTKLVILEKNIYIYVFIEIILKPNKENLILMNKLLIECL